MENKKVEWSETVQLGTSKKNDKNVKIHPLFSNLSIYLEEFPSVLQTINPKDFIEKMGNSFMGLSFDAERTLKDSMIEGQNDLSIEKILSAASNSKLSLYFTNGKIKYTKDNVESIATIPIIAFTGNRIMVAVDGDASLAEEAVKRIALFMYELASLKRTWPEIEKSIFSKDWKVGVEVDMKISTIDFLHPELKQILSVDSQKLLTNFGQTFYDVNSNLVEHEKKAFIEPEMNFRIKVLDSVSGIIDKNTLEIDRQKTYHNGTTVMRVIAGCDIQTLESLLNQISKKIRNGLK